MATQKILKKEVRETRKSDPGGTGRNHHGIVKWNYRGWKCEVKEDYHFYWKAKKTNNLCFGCEDTLAEAQQACKDAIDEREGKA